MSVALVGSPNVGKTALFNALTGSFQKVANFPGVTVERKSARLQTPSGNCEITDLPGLYTLDVATLDEKVARDWLVGKTDLRKQVVVVLDATHLDKSLYLLLQLLEIGHRPVVALTQIDQSRKRGQELDLEAFRALAGVPVIAVSATTGEGVEELKQAILRLDADAETPIVTLPPEHQKRIKSPLYVREKFATIESWLKRIVLRPARPDSLTGHIDRVVLHPVAGPLILLVTLALVFQALFSWASPLQDLIELGVESAANFAKAQIASPLLASLVADGAIAGVGSIVVFLPQILLLFLFIQLLEDVGYLGRAAFLMDGFMRRLGLPGKAIVPLLSSHACAIPGVLATRILEDQRERVISMLVIPLTTCSARLPVFTMLVAALVPASLSWGPFSGQGLAMLALYLFPMLSAILVAALLRKVMPHTSPSMLLMELPPYRLPTLKQTLRNLLNKSQIFLRKAGKVILALSIVIWVLVSFPRTETGEAPEVAQSYAATIGRSFDPVFKPLGFDWRINTALIPAFGAREVLVASLGTVFAVEGEEDEVQTQLTEVLQREYSLATLLALIVWFVFAPQCISTIAVIRRESNGWAVPAAMVFYTLALAWLMAFLTYQLFS